MYASPFDDAFGVFVALFLCLFLRWRGGRLGKGDGTVFFFLFNDDKLFGMLWAFFKCLLESGSA